ncbi:MAG: peptidoglycan-binding protein [Nannocystaceae bacterium]|nr:peptidoglycan-binding protein [Nannocystaceae bacterium]
MSKTHEVKQGECISSLAKQHGFSSDALWQHPDNSDLRDERRDPNVLAPGDAVSIPDKEPRVESVKAGGTYRFILIDATVELRLRLMLGDEVIRNAKYKLTVDGLLCRGVTDGDGIVRERIAATAKAGKLLLVDLGLEFEVALGHLDPATLWSGAAQRLSNLGFYTEPSPDGPTPLLRAALKRFQQLEALRIDGELGFRVADALCKRHGS